MIEYIVKSKGEYEGCKFRVIDSKIYVQARFLDLHKKDEFFIHPEFKNQLQLNKHLEKLQKEGFEIIENKIEGIEKK